MALIAAVKTVQESHKPITRDTVRDALAGVKLQTLQGEVAFDANGDLKSKVISVFQAHKDDAYPLDDVNHQFKYVGVAPQS